MLKKLLLISLMASLLGACGGNSIGPGAGEPDVTDVPDEEPTPTEPEVEPDCSPELTSYDFRSESEVEEWYVNADGTNIRLAHDPESTSALLIIPQDWTVDDAPEEREARVELGESKNLTDATIEFQFAMPQTYLDDGGLTLQFVLQGADWWGTGWINVDALPELSDHTEEELVEARQEGLDDLLELLTVEVTDSTTVVLNPDTGRYTATVTGPGTGVSDVTHIGVQLSQMPNDLTVRDPIALHRVVISEPATDCAGACEPEEILGYTFKTDEELADWAVNGEGDSLELALASGGGLAITPVYWDTAENWHRQAILSLDEPLDLRGATVTFTYDIPQSYIDDAEMRIQFPVTGESGDYYDKVGGYIDVSSLKAEGNVATATFGEDEDAASAISNFGLQLSAAPGDTNIKDTIILRSMTITFPCADEDDGDGETLVSLDFEDSSMTSWGSWNGSSFKIATDEAHEGSNSLLVTDRSADGVAAYNLENVTLETDTTYAVSVYVMIGGTEPDVIKLMRILKCADPAPAGHNDYSEIGRNDAVQPGEWTHFTGEFSTAGCEITEAQVYLEGTSDGHGADMYIDNLSISIVD